VGLASAEELDFLGEVVVDRQALDVGPPCDLGDGRLRGTNLLVELHRGLNDPLARPPLALCACLQLVPSLVGCHGAQRCSDFVGAFSFDMPFTDDTLRA
jgi:hypothetical protein